MFKVNIVKTSGFTEEEESKLSAAKLLWEKAQNSEEFKYRVLNFGYDIIKSSGWGPFRKVKVTKVKGFRYNKGYSNEEIYKYLMNGSELLKPDNNNQADIEVTLYYSSGSTVGYTYPAGVMQWMNKKFFSKFTAANVAGNLSHEWCHKIGFGHESSYNPDRKYTVPYAIGYLLEELAELYDSNPSLWRLVGTSEISQGQIGEMK